MSKLFTPAKIGPYTLSHRVVFAPMTPLRSDKFDTPPFALCDASCTQCGLRGPTLSMPCSQSARSQACPAL
jgi:hypothetical protein